MKFSIYNLKFVMNSLKIKNLKFEISASGFSMIETMVVVAVTAFLGLAVAEMTISLSRFTQREGNLSETQRHALLGLEPIRTAALASNGIVASRTILGTMYTTGDDTLVLSLPTINAAGDVIANSTDYVAFARNATDDTKLIRATEAAAGSRLATRVDTIIPLVSALRFRYGSSTPTGANALEVTIETEQTILGFIQHTPITTVITLGND